SVRIAGNVLNEDILGSTEFACKLAGSKQIVVLGHSKCGAIKGACAGVRLGNLSGLLQKVEPSIETVGLETAELERTDPKFIKAVERQNVLATMAQILEKSPVLREMLENGEIGITGGYYDVDTGEVEFIKELIEDSVAV